MKLYERENGVVSALVAPRRGAWIETWAYVIVKVRECVAPRRGAWIETRLTGSDPRQ